MTDPAVHHYISQMCEEVHFYGSKIIFTTTINYPEGYGLYEGPGVGPNHPTVNFSAKAKQQGIHILMKPIGGFQEPEEIERYLVEGKCDLFGLARAFMADPEYGKKLYSGRGQDITPCLKCNQCHGVMLGEPAPWVSVCSVNPTHDLGHKLHRMVEPAARPRKIAVIGGGPTGMRAATGAKVNIPNIPGVTDENGNLKTKFFSCLDTCGREPERGKHVIIVGGSEVGIETAMYLCGKGHDVTVLTRQNRLAHNASRLHYALIKAGVNNEVRGSPA